MSLTNVLWKAYDLVDYVQLHVAGVAGLPIAGPCAGGASLAACDAPAGGPQLTAVVRDDAAMRWLVVSNTTSNGTRDVIAFTDAGTAVTVTTAPRAIAGLAYRGDAALTTQNLYYCSGGVLYSYDVNGQTEQVLSMPSATMTCSGRALIYSVERGSLLFGFIQNSLAGLAEWLAP